MTATKEPSIIIAGDTLKWKISLPDYKASDGWVLAYALRGAAQINITAGADGADHLVQVAAATTAAYTPGNYKWIATVTKAGERYTVAEGYFLVQADLATATSYSDRMLALQTHIDAINGFLAKSHKYSSYAIGGRSLSSHSVQDLFLLKDRFMRELNELKNAEALKKGLGSKKIVRVRMT